MVYASADVGQGCFPAVFLEDREDRIADLAGLSAICHRG